MKYFLDSAKMDEIKYAYENYVIDGVTTNPRHIMLSGKSQMDFIEKMSEWLKQNNLIGVDKFPVSVEVNPHLKTADEIVEEGMKISTYGENFIIKIPCIKEGLIAAKRLESKGVRTNVTLVFSPSQALAIGKLDACFVSPFVGWKENSGDESFEYIKQIKTIYDKSNINTEIIVAAVRNGFQIAKAAEIGADIVTCGIDVYEASFEHPFTTYGMNIFKDAFDNTAK